MHFCKTTWISSLCTKSKLRVHLLFALVLISGIALAAHEAEEKLPEAASPQAPVQDETQKIIIPEYVTPLQSFQKYVESGEPDWKEANKLVGEIGGWRAYAREAYLAERKEQEAMKKAAMEKNAEESGNEDGVGESKGGDMKKPEGKSE